MRLVAMAEVPEEELNPFEVLGVEATATDAELRRAYRRLAVLVRAWGRRGCLGVLSPPPPEHGAEAVPTPVPQVHPDKSQHPRAEAAFKVLRAAWDIVSSPERRKEHEL